MRVLLRARSRARNEANRRLIRPAPTKLQGFGDVGRQDEQVDPWRGALVATCESQGARRPRPAFLFARVFLRASSSVAPIVGRVIDPIIVSRLVARQRNGPLERLTDRERDVLTLMAEGHSNETIGQNLFLSPRTVESHIRQIFLKLNLRDTPAYHRRVVAVLTFLRSD